MKTVKWMQAMRVAAIVVLLVASLSYAQVSTSSIMGSVVDADGLIVVGAKVAAKNEATGVGYDTTTTSAGDYTLSGLPPGSYTITVTHSGFKTFTSVHNVLTVGTPLVVDAKLQLGQMSEVVQVEASYAKIETSNAMVSDVVTHKEVTELPLNGRNPLNLVTLEPGLVQRSTNAAGSGTHVFGSRDRAHNITIDGIDANESSVPNPQSNIYRLTPDNVQEYRVVTHNATPEYGRNSGANVSIATRGGANDLHGTAFFFHRNTALNSNEWFSNALGVTRPILLLHQYGGDIGGPIRKEKTFFFFSYQGNKIKQTQPIAQSFGTPVVYTDAAKNGTFRFVKGCINLTNQATCTTSPNDPGNIKQNSPLLVDATGNLRSGARLCSGSSDNNCIDAYNIFASDPAHIGADPKMAAMIGKFPLPNTFTVGDGLNTAGFNWNTPSRFNGPFYMGRVDHKFNDNHNIFGRFLWSKYDTTEGDLLNGRPEIFPGFAPLGEVFRTGQNLAVSYRSVWSPHLVNEFTTGYSRFNFFFSLIESNQKGGDPPPYGQQCFGTPSLVNINTPYCNTPHTARAVSNIQFIDNLAYTRGAHAIRTGINFRLYRHNDSRGVPGGFNIAPTIVFDRSLRSPTSAAGPGPAPAGSAGFSLPSAINSTDSQRLEQAIVELAGIPARVQQAYQADLTADRFTTNLFAMGTRAKQFDWYIQDEWKMTRNFTLTYGLRWELNLPPGDCCGRAFVPDRAVDGSQGTVTFQKADRWFQRLNASAFAPRLSLAWNPRGGKTVVRAGWGIAFDTISTFQVTAVSGKVPGSVLQCRENVQGTPPTNCPGIRDIPDNFRLSQLLTALNPVTLGIPTAKPSGSFSPTAQALTTAPDVGAFDPNLKVPTVHEWSLTVQRELPWGFTGQIGYIGKRGMRLYRAYDLNQIFTNQPGFLGDFLRAQTNLFICRTNAAACLTVEKGLGIAKPTDTTPVDTFANLGLPGQQNLPTWSPLLGNPPNTSSAFRDTTLLNSLQLNGLGDAGARIDQTFFTSSSAVAGAGKSFFRPNAQFSQMFYFDSGGDSYYHGAIAQLRRRFAQGLTIGASYTFAKSIDDMSVDPVGAASGGALSTTNSRTPTDVRNFRLDRSRSDFDNRHVVVVDYLYELPIGRGKKWGSSWSGFLNQVLGGWSFTGIYLYQSGESFSINSGSRTVHNTHQSRADVRGPLVQPELQFLNLANVTGPVVYNVGQRITGPNDPNFDCRQVVGTQTFFCIPPPGQSGAGRNIAQGPSFWNFDMGVLKNFSLTERVKLQFRSEFYNVFNHANFENPRNASVGSPALTSSLFGQTCCVAQAISSSSTVIALGEPNRVIQFALKLSF